MGLRQGTRCNNLKMKEAFEAYERIRYRLPDVTRRADCHRLPNLDYLASEIDVFLLDAFGVLNIGETAIPGVPERVAGLQKGGKRVMVVSNAAGYPHSTLMRKYKRLGYNFDPEDVITSRTATLAAINKMPPTKWGIMDTEIWGLEDLEHLDITYLADDVSAYEEAEGFILMGSAVWTERRHAFLETSLIKNPRPVIVGNPDIVAPYEDGFSIEPGSYGHRLGDDTGVEPCFFGKPFQNIFDLAFTRLDSFDPARTIMVGDSLHTDILGGQAAGIKSALIAGYGFFAGHDVFPPIISSGIQPDYILDCP